MTSARDRIILASWDLFHERGIHDTSVDDILKKSETGKGQFYHYFGNKEGLIQAVLEDGRKKVLNGDIVGMEPIETWEDMRRWFNTKLEKTRHYDCKRACPIGRFAAELSENDEDIRRSVLLVLETVKQIPKEFFIKLKARGELRDDADPEELATFCEAVLQGGSILAKAEQDTKALEVSLDHAYAYLQSFKK